LIDMKAKTAQGVPLAVKTWTVERYLRYWLHEVAARRLRATTVAGYETVIRVHLIPAFGGKQLVQLSPQEVRRLLDRKRQDGCRCAWCSTSTRCCATPCRTRFGRSC
jgi:hypothetical protein